MKTNSISHKDVIDRFVSYGESNFELPQLIIIQTPEVKSSLGCFD